MRAFLALVLVLALNLVTATVFAFLAAVPMMWLFAALHALVNPGIYPIGYWASVLISLLVGWTWSIISVNSASGS